MIVLQNGEQLIRQDSVELFSDGRKFGKGTLYLTDTRLMFETNDGTVSRIIALHIIQSVVPVKKHEFTVSYMNDDGTVIFTDRYKIRDGRKCEDWIEDFQKIRITPTSYVKESTYLKSTTESRGNERDSSQNDRQNVNEVAVDVNSKTVSWKKVEGWRKFPEEHIWQGTERMDEMTKEQWLVLKEEWFNLDGRLGELRNEYFDAKKDGDRQRCMQIIEELKLIDKELTGRGVIPYTDIASESQ